MTDTEMMMLVVLVVLAIVVISQRAKQKPQAIEQPPANIMDPNAWEIGPIMLGDNESKACHCTRCRTLKAGASTCHTRRLTLGMFTTSRCPPGR